MTRDQSPPYNKSLIERQTSLSGHVVHFCRYLREKGFKLTYTEEADALQAIRSGLESPEMFVAAMRAALAKNRYEYDQFNDHYLSYIAEMKRAVNDKIVDQRDVSRNPAVNKQAAFEALKNWLYGHDAGEQSTLTAYSDIESLVKKDFSTMNPDEVEYILYVLQRLTKRMAHRKSRLKTRSKKKGVPDIRQTLRSNLRRSDEILEWKFTARKLKRLKIVVICDVSQSMDLYSRFFIQMLYAFQTGYDRIHTFAFSTALFHISDLLDQYDFHQAFNAIGERMPQWSGGTRMGASLRQFYDQFGYRMLNRKTVVFILSDGWDTGAPDLLKEAMEDIHRKSRTLVWLNPLAGYSGYEPVATGMSVALPFIDRFASAHNLESLKMVIKEL